MLARTTVEEVETAARLLADRANSASGPVAIVIPLRGFSSVDEGGQHFHDPPADAAFGRVVREVVKANIDVVDVNAHINDQAFAEALAGAFATVVRKAGS